VAVAIPAWAAVIGGEELGPRCAWARAAAPRRAAAAGQTGRAAGLARRLGVEAAESATSAVPHELHSSLPLGRDQRAVSGPVARRSAGARVSAPEGARRRGSELWHTSETTTSNSAGGQRRPGRGLRPPPGSLGPGSPGPLWGGVSWATACDSPGSGGVWGGGGSGSVCGGGVAREFGGRHGRRSAAWARGAPVGGRSRSRNRNILLRRRRAALSAARR